MTFVADLVRGLLITFGFIRKPDFLIQHTGDHPSPAAMLPGVIYLVGTKHSPKWAYLRCPKHEDDIIQLSLMQARRPHWTVEYDFLRRATVHPSVRQLDVPFAHFWITRGQVSWCADSGLRPVSG
jgi:hypothetical protein